MRPERKPLDGGLAIAAEKTRYEQMLGAVYKFRFFFVGLVFAMLSFAMQHPVTVTIVWVKYIEFLSWFFLIITGFLALGDCGGFSSKFTEKALDGLNPSLRSLMWKTFFTAVILLFAAKAMDSNYSTVNYASNKTTQEGPSPSSAALSGDVE